MRKTITGILIFTVAAVAAHYGVIFATPYAVLMKVKSSARSPFNKPVYADVITDKDRKVVLPNPDFLYVAAGYDIRKSPLKITGKMPEGTYSSIAFYSSNTQNYYIRNDRQTPRKEFNILLVKKGEEKKFSADDAEVVASPSSFGTVMMRILIDDTARMDYLKKIQHTFRLEEF
ncbi:MAG TPA: DUF1254 domain-containing protein [Chitinophagales bacterium]|nr:DUF1254 domain-containing protein [Chitinophagales bacterium]